MIALRVLTAALCAVLLAPPVPVAAYHACGSWWITGYVSGPDAPNAYTADGTPITTAEPIAAAPAWVPFGAVAEIADLGRYRIADRGNLGERHIDVRAWSVAEAYALTGTRHVCVSW